VVNIPCFLSTTHSSNNIWPPGGHDGGYASVLRSLETEGLLHKLTMLKSYPRLAYDVEDLNLPSLTIDGLFMNARLPSPVPRRPGERYPNPSPSPRAMSPESDNEPPGPPKVSEARKIEYSRVCVVDHHFFHRSLIDSRIFPSKPIHKRTYFPSAVSEVPITLNIRYRDSSCLVIISWLLTCALHP
jgi:hypothetical protein